MRIGSRSKLTNNNRGFSLVELVIVIAIIAVVGLGATLSIILIFSANAKTCANDILGAIAECKIETMSKGQGNVKLLLYRDGAGGTVYSELQIRDNASAAWETKGGEREKIGASKCTVTSGGAEIPTDQSGAWVICYNRSTGAFVEAGDGAAGEATTQSLLDQGIEVQGGSKHYRIKLERLTGKTTKTLE